MNWQGWQQLMEEDRKPRGKRRRKGARSTRSNRASNLGVEPLENRLVPTGLSLGSATGFNVFMLHDMKASISDAEGRVAVGGNADFSNYSVGSALTNSHGLRDDLIVGGNLKYHGGQVANGNVVYQGTADISALGVPNGTIRQDSVIDFAAAEAEMTAKAASWAGMAPNAAASVNYGSLSLFGTDPSLNIFSLTTNDLANANYMVIDAPEDADVLVNVSGTTGALHDFAINVVNTDKSHIFFNFFYASSLDIHSFSVQGNVLAPYANINFNNGNFEGTLVGSSFVGTGEFHSVTPPEDPIVPPPAPVTACTEDALGIATDFNVFVFQNSTQSYTEAEGRVAVGGDATFNGYGIGDRLADSNGTRDDLIVGGNLSYTNGQVFNGNVVYGGTAALTSFGVPNGTVRQDSVIDFAAAESALTSASTNYAGLTANGTVSNYYGSYTLTGTDPGLNVFNLTAGDLASANFLSIDAPANSTVLINVSGTTAQLQNYAIQVSGTDNAHVLFNFFEATSLQISGIQVEGSVLAPLADVTFNNGNINGTLVARSLLGSGEMHNIVPELHICIAPTPSSLSGYVYVDVNDDGIMQSGEAGITGATVTLTGLDDKGNPVNITTTTDANGAYSFTNLQAGTYTITETQPAGYLDGKDTIGTPGGTTNNDQFTNIVLPAGFNGVDNDFGELPTPPPGPSSLSGHVYVDANNDGIMQSGETRLSGVTVVLSGNDYKANPVNLTTTTDSNGYYEFTNLDAGNYTISETQPVAYLDGKDTIGTPGGTTANDTFSNIVLPAGFNGVNNNFGELVGASLAGNVYSDSNNDGVFQGSETGISGVTVTLTGTDDLGNPVNISTTTNGSGAYSFNNLRPGAYTISETQPGAYLDGKDTIGTPGGTTTNDTFSSIVLDSGVSGVANNFGELLGASLAGNVYYDANNDGMFQGSESGISGVTVTLTGTDDLGNPVNVSTTTSGSGAYSFNNLRPGNYTVAETQPGAYFDGKDTIGTPGGTTSNDNFSNIVLASGVSGVDNNFGEILPASLAGNVYLDANNDGVFQGTETGISGVAVTLTGTDDLGNTVYVATTTNALGAYDFSNLRPGNYTIFESQPGSYVDGLDTIGTPGGTTSNDKFSSIILNSGVNGIDNNFGELTPPPALSSLAGFVYVDANNDGIKQSGESSIAGVTVTLTGNDTYGPVNLSTTTDASGAYSFLNLNAGTYVLSETQPGSYLDGKDTIGTPGGTTSNDNFSNIVLNAGVDGVDNNFGELLPASLAGNVYDDANNDGTFQGTESGISGVTVTLTGTDDLGQPVNQSTTTTGAGAYSFSGLRPGTYILSETQPAGYNDGIDTIGTPGGTTSNDQFSNIVLNAGVNGVNNNFGEITPPPVAGSLSGYVYSDTNNDGTKQGSESGIAGVTVTLGGAASATTTTDATGYYSFTNLAPGTYTITETQPVSYLDGKDSIGTQGGTVGNDNFTSIVLNAGQNGVDNNFGELLPAAVSGFVYNDTANNNGIKEFGEAGIQGVTVSLTGTDDLGASVSQTTTTDSSGAYSFTNLRPGNYTITETQPSAYVDGKDTIGSQGGSVSNDKFTNVVLNSGDSGVNNNFGELNPASLSGYVYADVDNNGVKSGSELGLASVTVTLTGTDYTGQGVSITTTTDAIGLYTFTNLKPGTYTINETQPSNYFDGKDTVGTPGGTTSNDQFSNIVLNAGVSGVNNNFGELPPATLSGFVYVDADNDGLKESGESGISQVQVVISGTNDLGNPVNITVQTNAAGAYSSGSLRPGTYSITETQPSAYSDGIDTIGTPGGTTSNDKFSNIALNAGVNGVNNNFGEIQGPYVYTGQTATIGYWQNPNGQALINSFNGGPTSTALGNWLASTFPNVLGANAGIHNLAGMTNAQVAAYFVDVFDNGGSPKVEAQFIANAFAVYSTTQSLGGTNASSYGFVVDSLGVGNSVYNVGSSGAAFGVPNNSTISVMAILQAADSQAVNGVLYNGDSGLRSLGIVVFTGINETGDIP